MLTQTAERQLREMARRMEVTIGVAVYNGAATLHRAVESILKQTYDDCVIYISDDASTDNSGDIAEALAREHRSITVMRHRSNLTPAGNFRFLLQQAKTEYFMWLAADDYLEPTYVERMAACLKADPTLVACVSKVCFVSADGEKTLACGTYPLLADPVTNLAVYLSNPSDNARFYALYRTAPLRESFPLSHFHAFDYAAVAGTLRFGKFYEIPEVLMIRDRTPAVNYIKAVRVDNHSMITRIFPLLPMTRDLIFRQQIPLNARIMKALLYVNVERHIAYMAYFHPLYTRMTKLISRFWDRYIGWRLKTRQSDAKMDLME